MSSRTDRALPLRFFRVTVPSMAVSRRSVPEAVSAARAPALRLRDRIRAMTRAMGPLPFWMIGCFIG